MLKLKSGKKEEGFTMVDVLIAIIIASTFLIAALETMVIAAVFRVKAAQVSGATNLIQEQIEQAKYQAKQLDYVSSTNTYNPNSGACTGTTATTGYGNRLKTDSTNGIDTVAPLNTSKTLTVNGKTFSPIPNPNPGDDTVYKRYTLSGVGNKVWLLRHATSSDATPKILKLSYLVVRDKNNNITTDVKDIITEVYTEVIPDAAFSCPP